MSDQNRPLIAESSTSESINVQTILDDMEMELLTVPDYQRDSDQWDNEAKSLLIESVINNLSMPAFFFEVVIGSDGIEKNEVIDGQQRLTTLRDFFKNNFRLVDSDGAPYISPNSIAYAGKTFDELPDVYKQAFKKYRLAIIKLRELKDMRLEIFRRINKGGTPLSGHDIRLAYWGSGSKTISFIRVVGIFDDEKWSSKKFIDSAKGKFGVEFPWDTNSQAWRAWRKWWEGKEKSHGQAASQMFLGALVAAQCEAVDRIVTNVQSLKDFNVRYHRNFDEVLDAYCGCVAYQDQHLDFKKVLFDLGETKDFFLYFSHSIDVIRNTKIPNVSLAKHGRLANVIGISYALKIDIDKVNEDQWSGICRFIDKPSEIAQDMKIEWPQAKGRWPGAKGYKAQLDASYKIFQSLYNDGR